MCVHNTWCWTVCPCPTNWHSRSVTECLTCALNIAFQHKINFFVLMLSAWCVFHVFGCALSVYLCIKIPHINIRLVWVYFEFTLLSRAHGELKMVSNQHIANTKISWTHVSTNSLGVWDSQFSFVHIINPHSVARRNRCNTLNIRFGFSLICVYKHILL